ncbi:MAG: hypothetical protein EBU46_10990 [Nitrosomonadaceae bacterium]|nr:hypothetical protein [Nitrosomonadaceae bacterium]
MPDVTNPEFKRLLTDLGFTYAPSVGTLYADNHDWRAYMAIRQLINRPFIVLNCSAYTKDNIPARVRVRNENHKAQFSIVGQKRVMRYLRDVVGAIETLDYCVRSKA